MLEENIDVTVSIAATNMRESRSRLIKVLTALEFAIRFHIEEHGKQNGL